MKHTPANSGRSKIRSEKWLADRRGNRGEHLQLWGQIYIRFVLIEAMSDQEIFIRSRNFAPDGNSTTSSLSKTG
jgi:hypothetical protein